MLSRILSVFSPKQVLHLRVPIITHSTLLFTVLIPMITSCTYGQAYIGQNYPFFCVKVGPTGSHRGKHCGLGLPFSPPSADTQNVSHSFTTWWAHAIQMTEWWERCVSTHGAGKAASSLYATRWECRATPCQAWTHSHHMARDTCTMSPGGCAAGHTRRERRVSTTIHHQPFPISLLHATDCESQELAASQGILEGQPAHFWR